MRLPGTETRLLADARSVAAAAAELVLEHGRAAMAERGRFRLVLAGGSTPEAAYRLLARLGRDWRGWEFFFGDERCLPASDPERNSVMASRAWLGSGGIASEQIAVIPAEQGAEAAASAYAPLVANALPFDLVLLGIGEDGHTASLFPGREAPDQDLTMAVLDAPKPPPERVSLTPAALRATRRMLVLVTGQSKHPALLAWRQGSDLPVAQVAGAANSLVLMDTAAALG